MEELKLQNLERQVLMSTYLSNIYSAKDQNGRDLIVKRNVMPMTKDQREFFEFLMRERDQSFLIPLQIGIDSEGRLEEIYELIRWPLLSKFLAGARTLEGGLNFFHSRIIIKQMVTTLGRLHSMGFLHHDVRDRNVFIDIYTLKIRFFDYNSVRRPYYLSEGIASWNVVPPEYREGKTMIDYTFDVYQLGMLFYDLTHSEKGGRLIPFTGVTADIKDILDKATAKDKGTRYRDCNEMADELTRLVSE